MVAKSLDLYRYRHKMGTIGSGSPRIVISSKGEGKVDQGLKRWEGNGRQWCDVFNHHGTNFRRTLPKIRQQSACIVIDKDMRR